MFCDVNNFEAAAQGAQSLSQEIERQHAACNCPPKPNLVFDYQQSRNDDCECGKSKSQSPIKSRKSTNNSLRILDSLMDLIKNNPTTGETISM